MTEIYPTKLGTSGFIKQMITSYRFTEQGEIEKITVTRTFLADGSYNDKETSEVLKA